MIKKMPPSFILRQQLDDATHQTQLRARPSARAHTAQALVTLRTYKQRTTHGRYDQQCDSNQSEHPRPRLDVGNARLSETQKALAIAEALFTGKAQRIFLAHPLKCNVFCPKARHLILL